MNMDPEGFYIFSNEQNKISKCLACVQCGNVLSGPFLRLYRPSLCSCHSWCAVRAVCVFWESLAMRTACWPLEEAAAQTVRPFFTRESLCLSCLLPFFSKFSTPPLLFWCSCPWLCWHRQGRLKAFFWQSTDPLIRRPTWICPGMPDGH